MTAMMMCDSTTMSLDDAIHRLRKNDPQLTALHLDGCEITKRVDRRGLSSGLSKSCHLEELSLSRNQLVSTWPRDQLYRLFDSIGRCPSLRILEVTLNELDVEAVQYLTGVLLARAENRPSSTLESLDLSFNHLGDEGAGLVCNMLLHSGEMAISLQNLGLHGNEIGDEGAVALSRCLLQADSRLRVLGLKENKIGPRGSTALAQALPFSNLEELVLHFNQIRDKGASALAQALATSPPLRVLFLRENYIGAEGGLALAESLRNNKNLRELDLSFNNPIKSSTITALTNVLKRHNETLSGLSLWNRYRAESMDLQFYVSLNRMGRQHVGNTSLPQGCWPIALARVSNDCQLLYYFLRARPDMLRQRSQSRGETA